MEARSRSPAILARWASHGINSLPGRPMLAPMFEGPIPYLTSRLRSRFGSPISLTSDSDPVGLAWYKFLARETYAGTYFQRFHTILEEPFEQPFWIGMAGKTYGPGRFPLRLCSLFPHEGLHFRRTFCLRVRVFDASNQFFCLRVFIFVALFG